MADSLPAELLERWGQELAHLEERDLDAERRRRIEDYLDAGGGVAWMNDHRVAAVVKDALSYFDGVRYELPAWVIMPNHVHLLLIPKNGFCLKTSSIHGNHLHLTKQTKF